MSLLTLIPALFFGLLWAIAVVFLRVKRKKSVVYLVLFTLFYVYLYQVLDYTLFQYQSLLLLRYFVPGLILNGQADGHSLNLIPLVSLTAEDLKTSLLNVLLMVPLGLGLPFLSKASLARVVLYGGLFSLGIEFLQGATGWLAKTTFRIADINDLIFNTLGVVLGCGLFLVLKHLIPALPTGAESKEGKS